MEWRLIKASEVLTAFWDDCMQQAIKANSRALGQELEGGAVEMIWACWESLKVI
jgi:hypothetical protein